MTGHRSQDVHLILATTPGYGHVRPFRSLTKALSRRGYAITFICGSKFEDGIKGIPGVEYLALSEDADFDWQNLDAEFPTRSGKQGLELLIEDQKRIFFDKLPSQHDTVQRVLSRHELTGRKVVIVQDPVFAGTYPMLFGSPRARRVPTIMLGHFPLVFNSKDHAPFGTGLPSQGEEKNMELNAQFAHAFYPVNAHLKELLAPYECERDLPEDFLFNTIVGLPDVYCQLCVPAMEPPRSDLPHNVRFCGTLSGSNDKKPLPEWFNDFVAQPKDGNPLVLVTSGTVSAKADDLILPTIGACADLPVRLVVCAVDVKQPETLELPSNVRWAQWIAFEDILHHTAIVVSNGGYGGVSQAFSAGIPMVLAGLSEDKAEVNQRCEGTGAAIDLRTQTPSIAEVRLALQKVLEDPSYRAKAQELKQAYAQCDAVGSIVSAIDELSR